MCGKPLLHIELIEDIRVAHDIIMEEKNYNNSGENNTNDDSASSPVESGKQSAQ